MINLSILPGEGLGMIQFGMTPRQVEGLAGRASRADFVDDGEERSLRLEFQGTHLFFHQSDDFRLGNIEVEEPSGSRLFGVPIFDKSRSELLALLKEHLREDEFVPRVSENEDLEETSLDFRSLSLTLYFGGNDRLESVSWGVRVDQDDRILWAVKPCSSSV